MNKYRVFTTSLGWSEIMFIFDTETKFSDIKNDLRTKILDKENFVGTYEFDDKFLKQFNKNKISNKEYYYRFSYQRDELTPEEKKWVIVPDYIQPEAKKQKQHKDVEIQDGFSNASESLF
jgi:hypothetical protein